jgi:hypothetical protein
LKVEDFEDVVVELIVEGILRRRVAEGVEGGGGGSEIRRRGG